MLRAQIHENEIRRLIGLDGNGERSVDGLAPLGDRHDRCLYFVNKGPTNEIIQALSARAGCIVIVPRDSGLNDKLDNCVVLETGDPKAAIASVLGFLRDERRVAPWLTGRKV